MCLQGVFEAYSLGLLGDRASVRVHVSNNVVRESEVQVAVLFSVQAALQSANGHVRSLRPRAIGNMPAGFGHWRRCAQGARGHLCLDGHGNGLHGAAGMESHVILGRIGAHGDIQIAIQSLSVRRRALRVVHFWEQVRNTPSARDRSFPVRNHDMECLSTTYSGENV